VRLAGMTCVSTVQLQLAAASNYLEDRMESDDDIEKLDEDENDQDMDVMLMQAMQEVETPPNFLESLEYLISMYFVCIDKKLNFIRSF
jgi:hypothetical protein